MPMTKTKHAPNALTETIAVRLSEDECRALIALAQQHDRTISYIVRAQLRRMLQEQGRAA